MPTKKSIYDRTLRRWFPKRYIRMVMARHTLQYREKMEAATSREDRQELEDDHHWRMRELDDWLTSIEDTELVTKATRMDLSLDDIPVADPELDERPGHWRETEFRSRVLNRETRRALQKTVRERAPAYRKERREIHELYLKACLQIVTALTGVGGTIIGVIAIMKK